MKSIALSLALLTGCLQVQPVVPGQPAPVRAAPAPAAHSNWDSRAIGELVVFGAMAAGLIFVGAMAAHPCCE